jgi:hypothetical protein
MVTTVVATLPSSMLLLLLLLLLMVVAAVAMMTTLPSPVLLVPMYSVCGSAVSKLTCRLVGSACQQRD